MSNDSSQDRSRPVSRPFVVISGLPGSGKTTLARRLAPALGLPLIDKDDILERLFEAKGVGDRPWRRALSRESDEILEREAMASNGAVLVSFWRVPGMSADSGTPTDWLSAASARVVTVHCVCDLDLAAERFIRRRRHPGHLDQEASAEDVRLSLRALAPLAPFEIGDRIDVDTSGEPELPSLVEAIRTALAIRC